MQSKPNLETVRHRDDCVEFTVWVRERCNDNTIFFIIAPVLLFIKTVLFEHDSDLMGVGFEIELVVKHCFLIYSIYLVAQAKRNHKVWYSFILQTLHSLVATESVMVIDQVGIQVSTIFANGSKLDKLLEWKSIKDVLILEGARRYQFIFFIAARHVNPNEPSIVFFPYNVAFCVVDCVAPVCTTELGQVARLHDEFERRNCKTIGLSTEGLDNHHRWIKDINETQSTIVHFPVIADEDLAIAKLYGMLDSPLHDRTNMNPVTGMPLTVRTVFIIDPSKKVRLMLAYPASVGRNFDEILRCLDALQLVDKKPVATPANWKPGDEVIVRFDVKDEDSKREFGPVRMVKPYLRYTKI